MTEAGEEDAAAAQQLKIMDRAEQYALALIDAPGELPAPGAYTDAASIFAALRPKADGELAPVKLLRSSSILLCRLHKVHLEPCQYCWRLWSSWKQICI